VESQMMAVEFGVVVEQKRQRLADPHRGEIVGAPALEAEDAGKEFRRGGLVARRHNGVVKRDRHRRLPLLALCCNPG